MKTIVRSNSRFNRIRKALLHASPIYRGLPDRTIFLLGCQRSGTTMISRVFDNIGYTQVFGEYNVLANGSKEFRPLQIKDISTLADKLSTYRAPLKVMKPIVDSQRANSLLSSVPGSRVVWIVRDYEPVAISNVTKFGDNAGGFSHVAALLERNKDDWRGQAVSDETHALVSKFSKSSLSALESACLFWFARNSLYFEQQLNSNARVDLWFYDDFVNSPQNHLDRLLNSVGYPHSSVGATSHVSVERSVSVQTVAISTEIRDLCDSLIFKFRNNAI